MNISQEIAEIAAREGKPLEAVAAEGMARMSERFVEAGAEVYVPVPPVAAAEGAGAGDA